MKFSFLIILIFPFVFLVLEKVNPDNGLVWFVIQQIYYLPLGCFLPEPFFKKDSEIYFHVLTAGRLMTPLFYMSFIMIAEKVHKNFVNNEKEQMGSE